MSNKYLEFQVRRFDLYIGLITAFLVVSSLVAGRYFYFNNLLNSIIALVLGLIAGVVLVIVEYFINKQRSYTKGLELEEQTADKLDNLKIEYKQHIETKYGDLDLLVNKNNLYYGMELKNWAGKVVFENGVLKVDDWDNTGILSTLLMHCKLARDLEFGNDSKKFVNPVLIFGHKAVVQIPYNTIEFNGIKVIIATIKDFEQYIK